MTFDDVCGMEGAKNYLKSVICQAIIGHRIKGLLLFGAPGTGKSLVLEAMAQEARSRNETKSTKFFWISMKDVLDGYCEGISEEQLKQVFMMVEQPGVIIIEDLHLLTESIKPEKVQRIKMVLCDQMENVNSGVFVVATTNNSPLLITNDIHLKRYFNDLMYISLPHRDDRLKMLKKRFTEEKYKGIGEKYFEKLATKTRGLSGYDIDKIYDDAFCLASNRVKDTAKQALITKNDIKKSSKQRKANNDFNSFDRIAETLNARNGNNALEPKLVKLSRTKLIAANIIFALL